MEIVIRITVVYAFLVFVFRVLGKRELSQLSPFELVALLLVAEIVSPALTRGDESLTAALYGAATLFCLTFVQSVLAYRFDRVRKLTEAGPTLLVRRGEIVQSSLHLQRVRPDEIYAEMHKAGIERISQVKWGFLEPDGKMAFVRSDDGESANVEDRAPI